MKCRNLFVLFALFVCFNVGVNAQTKPPFWDEIQAFRKADSLNPPPKKPILFVGSSTIRLWQNTQADFPTHTPIINRGFGGSTLPDVIRYEDDVILKYKPKQIVFFCGENDLASSDTVTADVVFNRFVTLFTDIRKHLGNVPFVYLSIKPSPSRWRRKDEMIRANELVKAYLNKQKKTVYIDTWTPMMNADGTPKTELFRDDKLHMKPEGYAIWQKLIEPKLVR